MLHSVSVGVSSTGQLESVDSPGSSLTTGLRLGLTTSHTKGFINIFEGCCQTPGNTPEILPVRAVPPIRATKRTALSLCFERQPLTPKHPQTLNRKKPFKLVFAKAWSRRSSMRGLPQGLMLRAYLGCRDTYSSELT